MTVMNMTVMKWNTWLASLAMLLALSLPTVALGQYDYDYYDDTYGNYYEEEEWYDPSDWFDGDDYQVNDDYYEDRYEARYGDDYGYDYGYDYDYDYWDGGYPNYYTDDWYDDTGVFNEWY